MTRVWIGVGVFAVLVVSGVVAVALKSAPDVEGLKVANVVRGPVQSVVHLTGSLQPRHRHNVPFGAVGRVEAVMVHVGSVVRRGDLLGRLEVAQVVAVIKKREIDVRRSQLRLEEHAAEDESAPARALAALDVEQAQLDLALARQQLQALDARSPAGGVVAYVGVQPGDVTTGTATGVVPFVVVEDAEYVIEAEGEETDVRGARDGATATVTLAPPNPAIVEGRVEGIPQLRRIGTNGNPSTWSLTIRLSRNPDDTSIGRSARVDIRSDSRSEAVVAPTPAVFRLNGADTLLVSNKAGGWRAVTVKLGLSDDYVTELLEGPPPGTPVLTGSSDRLRAVAAAMPAPP